MRQRMTWLDYARVFAIISISSNHAITRAFYGYPTPYDAYLASPVVGCVFRAIIFIFSRIGVPFFLMITGALLLNKPISTGKDIALFYKHNLGRLIITCEIWLFISFWFISYFTEPEILHQSLFYIIMRCLGSLLFINQVAPASMWYIPMILCLYLLIPFVNIIVNKYSSNLMLISCGIVFLSAMLIPNINSICELVGSGINLDFGLSQGNLFSYYMLYILAGYCVSNNCFHKFSTLVLSILAFLTFALSCVYQGWEYTIPGADKTYYNFVPMALSSVFLFALFHRVADKLKERKAITYLSKISFGIYFVHIYIMMCMLLIHPLAFHPVLRFLLLEILSVGVSIAVISALSRIPILKKYVFMIKD